MGVQPPQPPPPANFYPDDDDDDDDDDDEYALASPRLTGVDQLAITLDTYCDSTCLSATHCINHPLMTSTCFFVLLLLMMVNTESCLYRQFDSFYQPPSSFKIDESSMQTAGPIALNYAYL